MGEVEKEEGNEEPTMVDLTAVDTYSLLGLFINILSAQAWQHMGLRTVPGTGEIKVDFDRAGVAVDCVAFLIKKLEPHLEEREKGRLRNLVADLQINFVRQREAHNTKASQ